MIYKVCNYYSTKIKRYNLYKLAFDNNHWKYLKYHGNPFIRLMFRKIPGNDNYLLKKLPVIYLISGFYKNKLNLYIMSLNDYFKKITTGTLN